jgi:hypothetical protein
MAYLVILALFAVGVFETKTSWALRHKPRKSEAASAEGNGPLPPREQK